MDGYFRANDPANAARLHATASPTMLSGGYRVNVIPGEAKATLDVRIMPDDDIDDVLGSIRKAVNNPAVPSSGRHGLRGRQARAGSTPKRSRRSKPRSGGSYATDDAADHEHGATDMAFLRAKGVQCYGIGPAIDVEDALKGFGSHSDQERILERELYRFVHFTWDIVTTLAASK